MKIPVLFVLLFFSAFSISQPKYDQAAIINFRENANAQFADSLQSPLSNKDRMAFSGLDFFPPAEKYYVIAYFKRTDNEKPFQMKTSTNRLPVYVKYGQISFTLDGRALKLNVYQNAELIKKEGFEDYLFLPFSDLTSGKETYIGGRYIDVRIPEGDVMPIDFNQAYNPYCAYNYKYSCPIVPLENDLKVEIKAGVKSFHD